MTRRGNLGDILPCAQGGGGWSKPVEGASRLGLEPGKIGAATFPRRGGRRRALIVLAALVCAGPSAAFPHRAGIGGGPRGASIRFAVSRDFTLTIDHALGVAEAHRRVALRLEALRTQFADRIGPSSIDWEGDVAQIRVSALSQTAAAQVSVEETRIQIHVHLPLLLSPLGGNVEAFLRKTAIDALRP